MYYNIFMKTKRIAIITIFSAIIIVLQVLATFINFGSFPITLTLIPIIVAGAIYGPYIGLLMGLVFGIVVSIMVVFGLDPSGAIMFSTHPIITVLTCLIKGALCGLFGAISYKLIKNNKKGIIVSATITPITNTLILGLSLILFFDSNFAVTIALFMSTNFVIELILDILLAPGLLNLINRAKSREI